MKTYSLRSFTTMSFIPLTFSQIDIPSQKQGITPTHSLISNPSLLITTPHEMGSKKMKGMEGGTNVSSTTPEENLILHQGMTVQTPPKIRIISHSPFSPIGK